MPNRILFSISGAGLVVALLSAFLFSRQPHAQPPVFSPAVNPYANGIYANGIVESDQPQGQNINIYPEVTGPITRVLVAEGQAVHQGDPLAMIDDSVQRASTEQQAAQAEAARALRDELVAEPRAETLAVAQAQVENAAATFRNAHDQLLKQQQSYAMDPRSVSLDALDNAKNAERIAATNLEVVRRQLALIQAGAWRYDIDNQQRQYQALSKAAAASAALLAKYVIRAPTDGVVLAVQASVGSYVSPQGTYDSYTQGYGPLLIMGRPQAQLAVRAYIDEILVHQLPEPGRMRAEMVIRGTNERVPLTFERIQPYISPKIELSDARTERVDLRVLPLVFRFQNSPRLHLYPGELVDVYVGQ